MASMLKRVRRDPRPIILAAMSAQYWMHADDIAPLTGYTPTYVTTWLRKLHEADQVWRQPGEGGKVQWKRKVHRSQ